MAVRSRPTINAIVAALVIVCGLSYRYSVAIFGINTDAAVYMWHGGASVLIIGLCYLATTKTGKANRAYLKALYPVLVAHFISDVFMRGNMSVLDHIATLTAAVIIAITLYKQWNSRKITKQRGNYY